jgi:hypothetical protein
MYNCFSGMGLGPTRLSIIQTIKAPKFSGSSCQFKSMCSNDKCRGNYFTFGLPDEGPSSGDKSVATFTFVTPHHKSSWRGKEGCGLAIEDVLLNKLLGLHNDYGRPAIIDRLWEEEVMGPEPENMFLKVGKNGTTQLKPYKAATFNLWFKDYQEEFKLPLPCYTTPGQFRKVWSDEVVQACREGKVGPTLEQAAALAGHTVQTLLSVYARREKKRQPQRALKGMMALKKAKLAAGMTGGSVPTSDSDE